MARVLLVNLTLLALVAPSCPLSPRERVAVLNGHEWIDEQTYVFEPGKALVLSVPRTRDSKYSLELNLDEGALSLPFELERSTSRDILKSKLSPELEGRGSISVSVDGETVDRLNISISPSLNMPPEMAQARTLRKEKKDFDGAVRAVESLHRSTDPRILMLVERDFGTTAYRRGESKEAARWWLRASHSAEKIGNIEEATARALGVAFVTIEDLRFEDAEAAIARARELAQRLGMPPHNAQSIHYYSGLLRFREGNDYLAAANELRKARDLAAEYGFEKERRACEDMLSHALSLIGSTREALEIFERASPGEKSSSGYLMNRGSIYFDLMEAELIPKNLDLPRGDFSRAFELVEREGPPRRVVNARISLAEVELADGNIALAEEHLAVMTHYPETLFGAVQWRKYSLARADIALARGRFAEAEALALEVERAVRLETHGETTEEITEAMIVRARARRAQGRIPETMALYEEALREIDALSRLPVLPRARSALLQRNARTTGELAALYLEVDRVGDAFAVLSRMQTAVLEELDGIVRVANHNPEWREYQRARHELTARRDRGCVAVRPSERDVCSAEISSWERVAEENLAKFHAASGTNIAALKRSDDLLSKVQAVLAADEALLATFRLGEKWLTFFVEKSAVSHLITELAPVEWISRAERFQHVYVVLGERTKSLEPHLANSTDGKPLATKVSFSYLTGAESLLTKKQRRAGRKPLIIADTDGTLPIARTRAVEVAHRLPGADLRIGVQVTRSVLLELLSERSVFHFIGHASLTGGDPWSTELRLAHGESVGIADLLSLQAKIELAVLEACKTGARQDGGSVGLPEVMIASGTRSVLATVRDLESDEASDWLQRFYEADGATKPAAAMREAIRAAEAAGDPTWRAFQLWGER
jgi:tetratricopeptide (TPR) repeat protein